MSSQFSPNPALNTRWCIEKDGKIFHLEVIGLYCTGAADKFKLIPYELKYEHKEITQRVQAEDFLNHIKMGVVKPDWSTTGSLMSEEYYNRIQNQIL